VKETLAADYNVAPTKEVYAVLSRPPSKEKERPAQRQLRVLTWGLVPSWAKDPAIGNRLINARVETVAEKPAFRKAFASRRCLLPADGYYEWYTPEQEAEDTPGEDKKRKKPRKQPFFIHHPDGSVLAMAGLYEIWRDPTKADDDPDRFRWTCTVLTTDAEDDLGRIHDRMPLLVEKDKYGAWLDPTQSDAEVLSGLLVPAAPGRLEAYPVSTMVNNVKNNGPELVEPLPVEHTDEADGANR
jgi:putative SOS response-associated peptidase YedK